MATRLFATLSVLVLVACALPARAQVCAPSDTTLCLKDGRFSVAVSWKDFSGGIGVGSLVPGGNDDSGLFWFFREDNWEMLVKMVDGCTNNGHFWVFAAATTNVEYTLTITDEATGATRTYFNPLGNSADAITDTQAFGICPGAVRSAAPRPSASTVDLATFPGAGSAVQQARESGLARFETKASCPGSDSELCLQGDRFRAEVAWENFSGGIGTGTVVSLDSSDSGLFWFFREDNWEMLVKMIDGCSNNDRFWVFAAATTNVAYTLRITDTVTGAVREYENPIGVAAPAIVDTQAFSTCAGEPVPTDPGKDDLVAPLPTLSVDPPSPSGSSLATVTVRAPGADEIRIDATGSGCGDLSSHTISGGLLELRASVAPFGTCDLEAEIERAGAVETERTRFLVEPTELMLPAIEVIGGFFVPGDLPPATHEASAPDIIEIGAPSTLINGGTIQLRIGLTPQAVSRDAQNLHILVPSADGFAGYYRAPVTFDGDVLLAEMTLDPEFFAPSSTSSQRRFEGQYRALRDPFDVLVQIVDRFGRVGNAFSLPLETEEVGSEEVQVSLSWDTQTDVDLHVVEPPPGEEIYFGNRTSVTGGRLDLDSNPACRIDGVRNENITWPTGSPLPGEHIVRVDYWSSCGGQPANYTVTTRVCGEARVFSGRFLASDADAGGAGSGIEVTRFTPNRCAFRVRGKAVYEDRAQTASGLSSSITEKPIRFAKVVVRRGLDDSELAAGLTKQDGTFDLQFQNAGEPGYYVEVRSEVDATLFDQQVEDDEGKIYSVRSTGTISELVDPDKTNLIVVAKSATSGPAFNIFDMGVIGIEKIRMEYGVTPPKVTWLWTKGKRGACSGDVSCFSRARGRISVLSIPTDPDEYDDMVLLHEFGHKWQHEQSRSDSPGGSHSSSNRVDPQLAWGEGSATFFAARAKGSALYIDTQPGAARPRYSIENLPSVVPLGTSSGDQAGAHSEALVAAILWDLADGGAEPSDSVHSEMGAFRGASYLLSDSFTDRATAGVDLVDFLDGWFCKGNGMRGDASSGVEGIVDGIHMFPYDFAEVEACE